MEALIPVVNRLQDILNTVGAESIQLPQLVVLGSQSSGKSSLLESIVGRSFLPRGTGIVTRRPLILQLIHCPFKDRQYRSADKGTLNIPEWGQFLHDPSKIYTDFNEIREEIDADTDRVAGSNKGICSLPINLKIYSATVVNLTLIDLPGITKVPVGEQPEDIEIQIRDLIFKYIENPNSIILAVTAANTDIATNECIKFAKDVDPDGKRTLAVLTKLDLMDEGTDATDVLNGEVIPVKLGIIGVVNRSQKDVINKKDVKNQIADEEKFLQKKYPELAYKNGTPYLAKTLNKLLMNHIWDRLPDLLADIEVMLDKHVGNLSEYGHEIIDKDQFILNLISKYSNAYCNNIDGTALWNAESVELRGGARICHIFHETFASDIDSINVSNALQKSEIKLAIRNCSGPRPPLFIPEVSFELLTRKLIKKLEAPSLKCVQLIYKELEAIIQQFDVDLRHHLDRFPKMQTKVYEVARHTLRGYLPITNEMVENLIKYELAYINTKHPDFRRDLGIVSRFVRNGQRSPKQEAKKLAEPQLNATQQPPQPQQQVSRPAPPLPAREFLDKDKSESDIVEYLLTSYFNVVKKTIQDTVPKCIMHTLVNNIRANLQSELSLNLLKCNDDLFEESDNIAEKRKISSDMVKTLKEAYQMVNDLKLNFKM